MTVMNGQDAQDGSGSPGPRDDGASGTKEGFFQWIRDLALGRRRRSNGEASLRDTLEELAEETETDSTPVSSHERSLLENIIHLRDLTAYDVMVPRADIVAVQKDVSLDGLLELMLKNAHSRLPVYNETLDDVSGIVHIKDVLACCGGPRDAFDLATILRRVLFVSPAIRVLDLLLEMRLSRTHMALIVDEYGGIDGLVTIEDLVEEIVGEIEDEHDVDTAPQLVPRPDGSIIADARYPVDAFEQEMRMTLLDSDTVEDIDTLGGLVFSLAGRVPARGELVTHPAGLQFEVLDGDPRRIRRLRVRRPQPTDETPADAAPGHEA